MSSLVWGPWYHRTCRSRGSNYGLASVPNRRAYERLSCRPEHRFTNHSASLSTNNLCTPFACFINRYCLQNQHICVKGKQQRVLVWMEHPWSSLKIIHKVPPLALFTRRIYICFVPACSGRQPTRQRLPGKVASANLNSCQAEKAIRTIDIDSVPCVHI